MEGRFPRSARKERDDHPNVEGVSKKRIGDTAFRREKNVRS